MKIAKGILARTSLTLNGFVGMLIADKHLKCRENNIKVEVLDWVPGHGGDVWFCKHENGDIGAYTISELKPVD